MTQKEWIAKQKRFTRAIVQDKNNIFARAINSSLSVFIVRIFNQGLDYKFGRIGRYTSESYKRYRRKRGRQIQFVNLTLEGILRRDIATSLTRINKVKYIVGTKTRENSLKLLYNIERYGKRVFMVSDRERRVLVDILNKEIQSLL